MPSQEPPKKKSKRDNGLFCVYSECTFVDVMYFVTVCTSVYHMEKTRDLQWLSTINRGVFPKAHAQSSNMHHHKTHLNVPHGRKT